MAMFVPTSDYSLNDTFQVNGVSYSAKTSRGESLPNNMFVKGTVSHVVLDTANHTLTFDMVGEVGLSKIWDGKDCLAAGIIPIPRALCCSSDQNFQMVGNGNTFLAASINGASFINITIDSEPNVINLEGDNAFTVNSYSQQIACTSKYFFILRNRSAVSGDSHSLWWYNSSGTFVAGGSGVTPFDQNDPRIFTDPSGNVWIPTLGYDEDGEAIQMAVRFNVDEESSGGVGDIDRITVSLGRDEIMCGVDDAGIYACKIEDNGPLVIRYIYHDGSPPVTAAISDYSGERSYVIPYPMQNPDHTYVNLSAAWGIGSKNPIYRDILFSVKDGIFERGDQNQYRYENIIGIEGKHMITGSTWGSWGTIYTTYDKLSQLEELRPVALPLRTVFGIDSACCSVIKGGTLYSIPSPYCFMICRSVKIH